MPCCHFAKGKTFEKNKISLIKLSKKKTKVGSKGRRLIFPEFLFFWMLYPEDHPLFFSVLTGFNLSERHPWFNEFVFWAANLATASTRLKLLPEVEAGDGVPLWYTPKLVRSPSSRFDRFVVLVCFCLVLFVGALTCRFETSVISTSGPAGCLDRHMSFGISGYLFSDCISSMERNHLGIFMIICMFWISPSASQEENG